MSGDKANAMRLTVIVIAVALCWLAAAPSLAAQAPEQPPATAKGAPAAEVPAPAPAAEAATPPKRVVDVNSDTPPPSAYDLERQRQAGQTGAANALPTDEGRSLTGTLVRTVLSLGFVVLLIYIIGKLLLTRLGRFRPVGGPNLRIIERLQVDTKNALVVIEAFGKQRFLVSAGGDKGLALIAPLSPEAANGASAGSTDSAGSTSVAARPASFGVAMARAADADAADADDADATDAEAKAPRTERDASGGGDDGDGDRHGDRTTGRENGRGRGTK